MRTTTLPITLLLLVLSSTLAVAQPADDTIPEEAPAEEAPAEEAPAEEAPAEEVPTEEVPSEEVPSEEVSTEEPPAVEAPAEEAPAEDGDRDGFWVDTNGDLRLQIESRSGFPLDNEVELDGDTFGITVFDLGGTLGYDKWFSLEAEVRLFSGAAFGIPPCPRNNPDCTEGPGGDVAYPRPHDITDTSEVDEIIVPRKFLFRFLTPVGQILLGHTTSHWGLGMVANDGADGPNAHSKLDVFNNRTHGDLVERLAFSTRPAMAASKQHDDLAEMFFFALSGDLVYRDENAYLLDGDLAAQAVLALGFRPVDREREYGAVVWEFGVYSVYRNQTDDDGDTLEAGVFDIFGRVEGLLNTTGQQILASVAVEAIGIIGETNRVSTEDAPEVSQTRSFGFAAEIAAEIPEPDVIFGIRMGLGTGDSNSDDDTLYRFTFDRDFKVGLILFDHVLAELTAQSHDDAIDPERSAKPPKGVEYFPTKGAVTSALFVNAIAIFEPVEDFHFAVGGLWARGMSAISDPTESFKNGGVPTNAFEGDGADRNLGVELDLMARYRYELASFLTIEGRVEYGVFVFGEAFDDSVGQRPDAIHLVSGRVGLYW